MGCRHLRLCQSERVMRRSSSFAERAAPWPSFLLLPLPPLGGRGCPPPPSASSSSSSSALGLPLVPVVVEADRLVGLAAALAHVLLGLGRRRSLWGRVRTGRRRRRRREEKRRESKRSRRRCRACVVSASRACDDLPVPRPSGRAIVRGTSQLTFLFAPCFFAGCCCAFFPLLASFSPSPPPWRPPARASPTR